MNDNELIKTIKQKAKALGYEKCGIISLTDLAEYREVLQTRIAAFPESKPYLESLYRLCNVKTDFPWAKSVIICCSNYGKYIVPDKVKGIIAKAYLMDTRKDEQAAEYKASIKLEKFLQSLNFQTATNREFGIIPLRWAAEKAGLGIIRKNNFFYTENGSWLLLEGFLIDKELTGKENNELKSCPENCQKCLKACPTNSLQEPYSMNFTTCISCLTTFTGRDMPNERYRAEIGGIVYGCDLCQDVCPYNAGKWQGTHEFPGLTELCSKISLENIVQMDYAYLKQKMQPKFWYVKQEDLWKWKVNAINAMLNCWDEKYESVIKEALHDQEAKVREMAFYVQKSKNILE